MPFPFPVAGGARSVKALPLCSLAALLCLAEPSRAETIDLPVALARVAAADPTVAANAANLRAADAAILQAGVRPRDVLGLDVEDFAGTGAYSPVERGQTTAWYERTFERTAKRTARTDAARTEAGVVARRNLLRLLDRLAEVQAALAEAQAAEAAVPVAELQLEAALSTQRAVNRRVARALDPLFAAERSRTAVAEARSEVERARDAADAARAALASWWGGGSKFTVDMASFEQVSQRSPSADELADLQLLRASRDAAQSRVRLAESGNTADPIARLGVRHFTQTGDVALVVGGSIPLGTARSNRGNVERARAEQMAVEAEAAVAQAGQQREIDRLAADRRLLAGEIARIDREVLPSAERAVLLARQGFARGGTAFTFLEISQAQQTVHAARSRRVELLRRFHLAGSRLDRLTGRHLALATPAETRS